jgi:hypothetical protein
VAGSNSLLPLGYAAVCRISQWSSSDWSVDNWMGESGKEMERRFGGEWRRKSRIVRIAGGDVSRDGRPTAVVAMGCGFTAISEG